MEKNKTCNDISIRKKRMKSNSVSKSEVWWQKKICNGQKGCRKII